MIFPFFKKKKNFFSFLFDHHVFQFFDNEKIRFSNTSSFFYAAICFVFVVVVFVIVFHENFVIPF